jgi:hypothetical protein
MRGPIQFGLSAAKRLAQQLLLLMLSFASRL